MKRTVTLKVLLTKDLEKDHLALHPNEGFDLGLMRVAHPLRLCLNLGLQEYLEGGEGQAVSVSVDLLNNCPRETLLVGDGLHHLLGELSRAVVLSDGERLFVQRTSG